jgi:hypothetical protein
MLLRAAATPFSHKALFRVKPFSRKALPDVDGLTAP